jgi:hypothetical protein
MMDMGGGMPPMDPSMGADPNMPMDDTMPQDGAMPPADAEMPTSFDSNFDAGVEADEETDPKKYIQQLTGKLSQTLNSYNNENGEPDTELGKYVLGMLVKQGVKGMDDKDKKEIIKKINTASDEDMPMDDEMGGEEEMEEPTDDMGGETPAAPEMAMESRKFNFTKKQIFESFGISDDVEVRNSDNDVKLHKITPDTKRGKRAKPFEAPKKFKK